MTISIGSSAQWRQILSSHSIVIVDFYADWCGPCKMIAPTFESLSTKYSKPNKIAFCKVDVDNQRDVAQQYGVRAMPTFLVLRNGSVIETIQGANPPALTAAVEKAVKLAGPGGGGGGGATFSGSGQRLGGSGVGPKTVRRPMRWALKPVLEAVIAFFGLYFWSLFSLDPYKSAENSPFNKINPPARVQSGTGTRLAARPGFKTLADLGSS
ncbi:thioredoxin-like protein [Chaetomium strumarium]|uniref:Thioredoxin-like protein n=1 Tax=Chaetomium strumarium TaxID=1170767 RepID=A0AAJ0H358_9PEZI|nr:thioredoxin-like protein [Chaetomium strumarium]